MFELIYTVPEEIRELRNKQSNALAWIQNFRRESHRVATINPVNFSKGVNQTR